MKSTNRTRAEKKELEKLLSETLDETLGVSLLPRGAELDKIERNQALIQRGCDYNVIKFVSIMKRMAPDSTVTEHSTPTRAVYME